MSANRNANRARWRNADGSRLAAEVFRRLLANSGLQDLHLGEHNGRVDLRGICAPEVSTEKMPDFRSLSVQKLKGQLTLKNVQLDGMDFSGAQLKHFLFFNSTISNCSFEHADCEHWRLFGANISNSTFAYSNLSDAVLGPWYQGRGNRYQFVDFSYTDLLGLVSTTATYKDCDFSNAKLEKIDFQSSSFIRCRFAGELRDVVFWDHGYKTGKPDANPMEDVDFTQAKLRWVAFRRLNLDRVRLPEDGDHIILKNYRCVLERALQAVMDNETEHGRGLRRVLANYLKWIGPKQEIGVFCRLDFREQWGEEGEEFTVNLLRRTERDCAKAQ